MLIAPETNLAKAINVTDLKPEERVELAMLLYKSGYTVRNDKKRLSTNKYEHYILYWKE